jgi:hypothetical protein
MKIARVFPTKTSMTPTDQDAYFGPPDLFTPQYDEVHISCVFTWDKKKAQDLFLEWGSKAPHVKIGGPACGDPGEEFVPGMYLRPGITITSRGCPNSCWFCHVPKREGKLRELEIKPGNIIQDNNFLACSIAHRRKVYEMLKTQRQICFKGGLEASRITTHEAEILRGLRIKELWLACDTKQAIEKLRHACEILHSAGFTQNHLRCFVLIGGNMAEAEARLRAVYEAGALPFAQLYQPEEKVEYHRGWKTFARTWSRPAAYKTKIKAEKEKQ